MFDADPFLLFGACVIIKFFIIWLTVRTAIEKPLIPFLAIIGFLTAFYTYGPNQVPNLPQALTVTLLRFYFLFPLSTLILTIWLFRKVQGRAKSNVLILGIIDIMVTLPYLFMVLPAILESCR